MSGDTAVSHGPTTDSCRYCWMCRHVCPTGFVTQARDAHAARLRAAHRQRRRAASATWNADTIDALYHCADCGCCESHCATHQPLPEAIVGARASLAAAGLAPGRRRPTCRRASSAGAASTAIPDRGRRRRPARSACSSAMPCRRGRRAASTRRSACWRGPASTAVVVGAGQSTGLVASALGFVDTAKTLAAAVLADVAASGCRQLLVLGPGDRFAFDRAYASRLGVTWPEGVRVREATAALAEAHASGTLRFQPPPDSVPWAYQEPDHAVRVGDRPWPRPAAGGRARRRPRAPASAPGRAGASVRHRRRPRPDPAGARRRAGGRAHRGRPIRGRGPAGHRGSGLRPAPAPARRRTPRSGRPLRIAGQPPVRVASHPVAP